MYSSLIKTVTYISPYLDLWVFLNFYEFWYVNYNHLSTLYKYQQI
jgi:hypothetical protein